ncbi:MAG: glycoside hydrolase family 3 protein [Gammaproteobacteria bacterium]|nr:glycoside hydrolase family 3 protein [Gammaproteobacteria bacterium]MDD9959420.1 glycoside hydrolase family 3 protein [Gammaproteobacteria bacterium]
MLDKVIHHDFSDEVEALLSSMTLEQKIGQMTQAERQEISPEEVREFHIGSVLSGGGSCPGNNRPADWISMCDAYWQASMQADENHLAIPLLYAVDAIHGNANVLGATVFPHNIGLGACNEPELIEQIARITAREILATGVDWTFAPTLAVARNDRWGRTYESYSEDPAIVSSYSRHFVNGMQADLGDEAVIACAKHWIGDGGTLHGIDQGETTASFEELEKIHMAPYLPALAAEVQSVMVSFNSWNGDKCHGHQFLVTEILKQRLGFDGIVISDWDGIDYLSDDPKEAIRLSVNAGIDMFMVSVEWRDFIQNFRELLSQNLISMSRVDDAVRRILTVKYRFGLFNKPRPAARKFSNDSQYGSAEHRRLAREAVRKSLVLLKNDNQILPLKKHERILVAGRNADNRGAQCGGFTVEWQGTTGNDSVEGGTSVWEAIKGISSAAEYSIDGQSADRSRHDVAIVVIGENPYAEGMGDIRAGDDVIIEAGSMIRGKMNVLEPYGSSLELAELHPQDLETITTIAEKGIPVVCVLISGRPLVVNAELEKSHAFVAAWLPGSEGQGVTDVLFGEHDFQGKLSFSWPKHKDQQQNVGQANYDPLFPYGFGMRY